MRVGTCPWQQENAAEVRRTAGTMLGNLAASTARHAVTKFQGPDPDTPGSRLWRGSEQVYKLIFLNERIYRRTDLMGSVPDSAAALLT